MIQRIGKRLSPLCFLIDGRLVCYKRGALIILKGDKVVETHPLFSSFKERWVACINPLFRLLRIGIRAAETIDNDNVLLSIGNSIYEYNLNERKLSEGYYIGAGIRPLIFTTIKGIEGFEDCVVFGGYRSNRFKEPVYVYRRIGKDNWKTVYTFGQGSINHVHNIIPDPYRKCLWIFTGDFDDSSAIWKVTDNFKIVERVLCNDQKYRGCVAFALKEGLLYATDAPFADNNIYLMKDNLSVQSICPINGSNIYGCRCGDKYVFSTTVEPDGRNNNKWTLLFNRTPGAGIKDIYVHMYVGDAKGFKDVYMEKKDLWPYLFQFGAIRFPYGYNPTGNLYFEPVATNKNDLKLLYLDLN